MIIPFILSMCVGIFLSMALPKIYRSQTLILVQPQKVPQNYVQSLVSADTEARISTISQQIMSRSNLEKIIDDFKIFSNTSEEKLYSEQKIELMRKNIEVKVTRAQGDVADAFVLSYQGENPKKVMQVANALATYFIDENLKVREDQAIGTSTFLNNERSTMKEKLEQVEEQLKLYKERYMGELPEQLEANLRAMDRLNTQMAERQQSLQMARSSLLSIERSIEEFDKSNNKEPSAQQENRDANGGEGSLKAQLAQLKAKYTDKHPDVIRLKSMIEDMEKNPVEPRTDKLSPPEKAKIEQKEAQYRMAVEHRKELQQRILIIENDIESLRRKIQVYQNRVEDTPKREQELMSLQRDYNNIQEIYSSLLNRKLESDIAVNMEKKQKGEQFRIIDYAKEPEVPISPNVKKLFLVSLVAGLGIGCGLIYLIELMNTSFRSGHDIEASLGIEVLATFPKIENSFDTFKGRFNKIATVFASLVCFGLLVVFSIITLKGTDFVVFLVREFL